MKEEEIRPQELFNRYLKVAREDIDRFFSNKSRFLEVACLACGSKKLKPAFVKLGFEYKTCAECESLFLSPRPSKEVIDAYYREGEAVKFWSTDFYRQTAEARREKIFVPRAELIRDLVVPKLGRKPEVFAEIGSGYGIFLEEVCKLGIFRDVVGIEPAPNMAEICRSKGFRIVENPVELVKQGLVQADIASTFEVLEHVFSPEDFLISCGRVLKEGGLLLFTTLTISGFDLQVLWSNSKSIYPPHHINLLSFEGMHRLVERCGYEIVELSTPGKLDVDIVMNALREDAAIEVPRFVRSLIERRDEGVHREFQGFLQSSNLSSHIRCVARNKAKEQR